MRAFVIVATKGRAKETRVLLDYLVRQTMAPTFTVVVGSEKPDIDGLETHPLIADGHGEVVISAKIGLTAQRNFGIKVLEDHNYIGSDTEPFFCTFFDDDYRPAATWLQMAEERFAKGDVVGLSGHVLVDGVTCGGLSEIQAENLLERSHSSQKPPSAIEQEIASVYGCNMAFVDVVVRQVRFDENLPLYGWLEDRDYTTMASKLGSIIYYPDCEGVHLGIWSGGRASGKKFGYAQIMNPIYLMGKGTTGYLHGLKCVFIAFVSNALHSLVKQERVDYRGRLNGNLRALRDIFLLRATPRKIADPAF